MSTDFLSCSVSVNQNDFRYYASTIDILTSEAVTLQSDSLFKTLPNELRMWDNSIDYWSNISNLSIPAKQPSAFQPNPWTQDYVNLWKVEDDYPVGRPWDNTTYDNSVHLEFPKGFLEVTPPTVEYVFNPYQSVINLDIPPFDIPDINVPYLVLPDLNITKILRRGLRRITINATAVCMNVSESFQSHSKYQTIDLTWNAPSTGKYVLMVENGQCTWQPVGQC